MEDREQYHTKYKGAKKETLVSNCCGVPQHEDSPLCNKCFEACVFIPESKFINHDINDRFPTTDHGH